MAIGVAKGPATLENSDIEIRRGGLGSRGQVAALATLCVVLFLTFLDNTVVSVGLANIQTDLHAGVQPLQWVVNGYALVFAGFMLAGGTTGDLLGRKKVMLAGVGVFCAGSVVCALAPNVDTLIAGRVIMGLGAAASEPGTLSVLRHVYPDRATRADALGVWAAVSGLALALGPVIAGGLVGFADWRAIFWFNLALGAAAFVLALVFVPESSDRDGRRFDVAGTVLAVVAVGALSFAIIQGESSGYTTWWIDALFALAAVAGVAFVAVEHRIKSPMVDLRFFRRPAFAGSNFVAFVAYFGIFAIFFFTALYLQVVANKSAYQTAVIFLPMAAGLIVASALTGPWVARVGSRVPMVVGCLIGGAGILATGAVLGPHSGLSDLGWTLPLTGIGFGIALVPVTSAALTVVPPERSGMAASATNTSRELGAVFGVAVLGSLVNAQLTGHLSAQLRALHLPANFQNLVIHAVTSGGGSIPTGGHGGNGLVSKVINAAYDAFGNGLHLSLEIGGAMLLSGAVVALFTIRHGRAERDGAEEEPGLATADV